MILIKNGYLRPVTSPDIACGDILIDEGKIVAIGTDLEIPEGAEVIQAAGYLVTPGFVDGHCHIGMHEEATNALILELRQLMVQFLFLKLAVPGPEGFSAVGSSRILKLFE